MPLPNTPVITGLMSGTSLDGLDVVSAKFIKKNQQNWGFEILASACFQYDTYWKDRLSNAVELNAKDLLILDLEYGKYLGKKLNEFHIKHKIKPLYIASHGHTIFHEPSKNLSFQAGNGAAITAITGISSITSFRSLDVQLGGQGAPLVPVGDLLLFSEYNPCLNLGGIANITIKTTEKNIAFDISPCNLILNYAASKAGKVYDEDGVIASEGKANPELLKKLNAFEFYDLLPPKSLDKENLMRFFIPILDECNIEVKDILATLVVHIGQQIAKSIETFLPESENSKNKMLLSGGGAFNKSLIKSIETYSPVKIHLPSEEIINFKEALVFAFLGLLRTLGQPNCLWDVTGAERDSCGGHIAI